MLRGLLGFSPMARTPETRDEALERTFRLHAKPNKLRISVHKSL